MAVSDNRRPSGGHTLFRYTAKDIDGRTVRGTMEAADYDALYAQLLEQGLYPQRVTGHGADRRPRTLRPQELSDLCRQLSTLLASGVSLVRALTIISQDEGISAGLRRVYESVLSEVRKGSSLSDALEAQQVFPALMLGMGVRSVLARRRLQTKGEKVTARVTGTAQGRDGQAYVLEFETAGGSHRLHYPKAAKGKGFAAGETVTLYYDPENPEKMYVEGDRAVLGAEVLYFALAVVLVLLMAGFVR